jgi:hypothetical protein
MRGAAHSGGSGPRPRGAPGRNAHAAARHACSAAVTSLTREVAGYALGVVVLDSDGEAVAVAVFTCAASEGQKERRQRGARTARWWGPVGNEEG